MPSPRPYRSGAERSMSFTGRGAVETVEALKRPRTVPDLKAAAAAAMSGGDGGGVVVVAAKKVLTKVLINVTIQGSVGAVQVLVSPENTVAELITAVVKQYVKEGRRPVIFVKDVVDFDLHFSQFSLDCLGREEKLAALGSRNFFMCKRRKAVAADAAEGGVAGGVPAMLPCSKQAEKATKLGSPCPWLKFMSFLF